jgi:hypothetical protein
MDTGESHNCCSSCTAQGATAYYNSTVQIDGSYCYSSMARWFSAPAAGNTSSKDVYTYTALLKQQHATFTVLASQTQFA